ncbi:MAG: hypothetical protein KJ018_19095, partial [Burkholderiales bacterium]|nr:hypothetical protein [Burkholderiales bacterium]
MKAGGGRGADVGPRGSTRPGCTPVTRSEKAGPAVAAHPHVNTHPEGTFLIMNKLLATLVAGLFAVSSVA